MTAATNEPALEPEITSGNSPCSSNAFVTPIWNGPSAPAPLNINAERPKHKTGAAEQRELLGRRHDRLVDRRRLLDRVGHLGDVVRDQIFRAELRARIHRGTTHAAGVAVNPFAQVVQQRERIARSPLRRGSRHSGGG